MCQTAQDRMRKNQGTAAKAAACKEDGACELEMHKNILKRDPVLEELKQLDKQ